MIPKQHVPSLLSLNAGDNALLIELFEVVQRVAANVVATHGACRIVTNLGTYHESKHLHWHVCSGGPQP